MNKKIYSILSILIFSLIVSCGKEQKNKTERETIQLEEAAKLQSEEDIIEFNLDSSKIFWEGSALTKSHDGSLSFKKAELFVNESEGIYGGNFWIDMYSLTVLDLDGDDKLSLEGHLKGTLEGKEDHFFDVNKYPYAKLEIVHAQRLNEYAYLITANLNIKEQTRQIEFNAKLGFNESEGAYNFVTEKIKIDRTKFGIKFMSSNFFDGLGDKAINDEITVSVNAFSSKQT